jgi:RNA polymerase sigma-70 factor (ECF subfamily)
MLPGTLTGSFLTSYDRPEIFQEEWEWSPANFEQVVLRYQSRIYQFIYYMVGEPELAQDLTQDTFLRAYRYISHSKRFEYFSDQPDKEKPGASNFTAWLYKIARNTTLSEIRRRKVIRFLPFLSGKSAEDGADEETAIFLATRQGYENSLESETAIKDELQQAIKKVGSQRLIPLLLYVDGFSYKEIALITGESLASVKTKIFRAKKYLQQALNPS